MAKYQRYAQSRGFNPFQVSNQNVQNILNKGRQDAQNLREVADAELGERKRQAAAMQDNFKLEQQQRDRDYQIQSQNMERELRGLQAQAQQDEANQANLMQSFATLSKAADTYFNEYKVKQDKIIFENDVLRYNTDADYREKVDAAYRYNLAQNNAANIEGMSEVNVADAISYDKTGVAQVASAMIPLSPGQQSALMQSKIREGYPEVVSNFFSNPDNTIVIAGREYKASEVGVGSPLYGQAVTRLGLDFLEENGFNEMSMEALSPGLKILQAQQGDLITESNNVQISNARNQALDAANSSLASLKGADFTANLPLAVSQLTYANAGDYNKVIDHLFKLIGDTKLFPEGSPELQQILDLDFNGKPLSSRKTRMADLRRTRDRQFTRDWNDETSRRQTQYDIWWKDNYDKIKAGAEGKTGVELAQYLQSLRTQIESITGQYNLNTSGFDNFERRLSSKEDVRYRNEMERKIETKTLEPDDYLGTDDPKERERILKAYQQQEIAKKGPAYAENQKELKTYADRLTAIPGQNNNKELPNPYSYQVFARLKADYEALYQGKLEETGNPAEASKYAMEQIQTMVQDAMENKPDSKYRRTLGKAGPLGFPGLNLKPTSTLSYKQVNENIAKPGFLNQAGSVLTPEQLKIASSTWNKRDGSFVMPWNASYVAGRSDGKIDAFQVLNRQIEAYNKTVNKEDQIDLLELPPSLSQIQQMHPDAAAIFQNGPALSTVRAGRAVATMPEGQPMLMSSVRLPGAEPVQLPAEPIAVTGSAKQRTVQLGQALYQLGYRPWQHSKFNINTGYNPAGGERVMQRSYNSSHHHDEAMDFALSHHSPQQLNALYDHLLANKEAYGVKTILWQTKGHFDHLHVDFDHNIIR